MPTQRPLSAPVFGALALAAALSFGSSTSAHAAQPEGRPVAVSPGDATKVALIRDDCPTFSWGEVDGAKSYDLVVYRLGEQNEHEEPVLLRSFPGSVNGWTPALDQCLERGARYAWSVRAVGRKETSEWSAPNLFAVAPGPSEAEFEVALEIVRQYVTEADVEARRGRGASPLGEVQGTGRAFSGPQVSDPLAALAPAAGDSDLMVNGAAVVTTATFAGALCSTFEVRFLDLGDGTVLDCNTGKMWLKDANCLWLWPYEDGANPNIFTKVADLNGGTDFGCTDYTPGTYTDWEVPEMTDLCGLWEDFCGGSACCTASAGIVDTSVGTNPTVGNAAGDGQWAAEDAFVGVVSSFYWSATEWIDNAVWFVDLSSGSASARNKAGFSYVWPVRGGQ